MKGARADIAPRVALVVGIRPIGRQIRYDVIGIWHDTHGRCEVSLLPARGRFARERHTGQFRSATVPQNSYMRSAIVRALIEAHGRYSSGDLGIELHSQRHRTGVVAN